VDNAAAENTNRGELFILSAPSGSGKTTLIRSLLSGGLADFMEMRFSVSHTTRNPRDGEVDGKDYHFVSHETFQRMLAEDEFLEWAEVHNNYYGTANAEVIPRLDRGIDVIMDIDVQGAERIMAEYPKSHSIFIMPPSYEDLKLRLEKRGLDDPAEVNRRLAVSLWEIRRYQQYEYVIINDGLNRAGQVLAAIILEKRHRSSRIQRTAEAVLNGFPGRDGASGRNETPTETSHAGNS